MRQTYLVLCVVVATLSACSTSRRAAPPSAAPAADALPASASQDDDDGSRSAGDDAPTFSLRDRQPVLHVPKQTAVPALPEPRAPFHGQRISLDLKDADIRNVLRLIAEVGKLNIAATEEVQGKVTLRLFDVPWDEALDIVLRSVGLDSQHEGNLLRVSTLKRLREEREERHKARSALAAVEPLHTAYLRLNYAKAERIAAILGGKGGAADSTIPPSLPGMPAAQEGVLSERGSVFADDTSNCVIVRDVARGIETARELVRQLDVQTPQVLIESRIVEATSDLGRDLGIQWGYSFERSLANGHPSSSRFPQDISVGGSGLGSGTLPFITDFPAASVAPGMGSAVGVLLSGMDDVHNLEVRLSALEREGRAKVISRPRVVTLNNVPATIKSLTVIRVKLPAQGTVVQTGSNGASPRSIATEKIETGIVLVVTPQVSSDGFVMLDLFAKSSQADFTRTVDEIPTEISREASSHVLVRDGQTVVLGGIYRESSVDQSDGVPYLKDIPVLGWLFRSSGRTNRREDLLVFLTPHIVDPAGVGVPFEREPFAGEGFAR